ncbi:MAG: BBP7 family outer membrane beta-barrel protein, partial [Pirellulales bacterium]|nr:BBP7 family outer membrane beta-barrel protein [Pirellulales bacterium]
MPRLHPIWLAVFLSSLWVTISGFSSDATASDTSIQPGVESQPRVESLRSVRGKLERRQNSLSGKTSYALRDLQTGIRYRIYTADSTRLRPFVGRTVRMRGHGWNRSDIDVGYLRIGAATEPTVPPSEAGPAEPIAARHNHNHNEPANHTEPVLLSDSIPQTLPAGWVSRNGQTPVAIQTPVSELNDAVATFGTLEIPTPVGTRLHDLDLLDNPSHRCPQCGALPDYACGPAGAAWVRAEYLYWRSAGMSLPPLVTTSPITTPTEQAGIL